MRFEDVHWQGGRILGWTITPGDERPATATAEFRLAVFKGPGAADRIVVCLVFEDVESLSLSCSFPDLADHFSAGNIHWAHREGARNYRFELFGNNSFEVVAGKVRLLRES